jgi:hypothetical protein
MRRQTTSAIPDSALSRLYHEGARGAGIRRRTVTVPPSSLCIDPLSRESANAETNVMLVQSRPSRTAVPPRSRTCPRAPILRNCAQRKPPSYPTVRLAERRRTPQRRRADSFHRGNRTLPLEVGTSDGAQSEEETCCSPWQQKPAIGDSPSLRGRPGRAVVPTAGNYRHSTVRQDLHTASYSL